MKLADARKAYREHSTKASDIARQLAFAGFGIIWVFRRAGSGMQQVPSELRPAASCFAFALAADLLQYTFATACWGIYHRYKERLVPDNKEFRPPVAINAPAVAAFWVKLGLVAIGYLILLAWL